MPNFDNEFIKSKGAPIKYKNKELVRIDRIPVNKKFSGYLKIISTNSEWKQGIRLKVDGSITIKSSKGQNFILWADDIEDCVHFEGTSKKAELIVWNAWDTGRGSVEAWLNGAAMIVEVVRQFGVVYIAGEKPAR